MKSLSFRDFDAFSHAVRDVDSVMMLQNPRRRLWTISHVNLPGIHLQLGRLGSGNIVEGESWSNGYLFYMPLTPTCAYSANGIALPKHSFLILEPGCDFCVSTKSEHDWCSIFVPTDKIPRDDSVDQSPNSERMICRVSRSDRRAAERFRTIVDQVMLAAAKCSEFESSAAASGVAAELQEVASLILGQQPAAEPVAEGRPKVSRDEVIRRAKETLEQRHGQRVRVGELAAAANVSERTLRTAFQEYFGVSPTRYLQLRHLHQIHRALRAADPEMVSATDVMVQHGEWEFGRVARRYRQLFGERPSETLQGRTYGAGP